MAKARRGSGSARVSRPRRAVRPQVSKDATQRALPRLAPRAADSHEGDFGRALLIGGSRGMAGAIALAGMACLRSGAGLVRVAVPDCCLETVAQFEPCYMTWPIFGEEDGRISDDA